MGPSHFMFTKRFHPQTYANQRKVWIAEQAEVAHKKKEKLAAAELMKEHEQERLVSATKAAEEDKVRKHMDFMYKPPPGFQAPDKKKDEKQGEKQGEIDKKQKPVDDRFKNAPKESYAKDMQIRAQPFGIEVRTCRCAKCGKYGHKMGDRECQSTEPSKLEEERVTREDPVTLIKQMEADGLKMKRFGPLIDENADNQKLLLSDEDEDVKWLDGLSKKEKKRLLSELEKHEANKDSARAKDKNEHKQDKKSKKSSKKHHRHRHSASDSSSDSESDSHSSNHKRRKTSHSDK